MKIGASSISFAASHSASTRTEVHETLRAWVGEQPSTPRPEETAGPRRWWMPAAAMDAAQTGTQAPETNPIEEAAKAVEKDPVAVPHQADD